VSPDPAAEARLGDLAIIRRLIAMARPEWGHIAALALLTLAATPIALLAPIPTAIVVDSVLSDRPLPDWVSRILPAAAEHSDTAILVVAFALTIGIALVRHLNGLATWLLQVYTGERLVLEFRTRLLRNAQRLSFSFHDRRGVADSTYRIQYDAASIQWVLIYSFISILSASLTLLAMFAVTARIDVRLALVALGVAPVLVTLSLLSRSRLKRQWVDVKRLESSAMGLVQEALGATRVVRAFGREDHEETRFADLARDGLRTQVRVSASEGIYQLAVGVALATATGLVMIVGAHQVQSGQITLGELLIVLAYLAQLLAPLSALSTEIASLQGWFVSAGRALELLDERPDVIDSPSARPLDRASGHIEFRNVWMAYEGDRWALRGATFEVRPGMRVGIQGQTGAGKSTIISLLPRFYDPAVGAVLLDGVDLRQYRLADLREQFAIVLQEPVLFGTTIGHNIAYARPGASRAEIVQAAIAANAHDFIAALPQGYETEVGERGLTLSGGERQRISLARAFLKDAPILILDEPTSSVDSETETAIMEAMDRLMAGRTAFIVAHRLSTLDRCDLRLRVKHGTVEVLKPRPVPSLQKSVLQQAWEPPT